MAASIPDINLTGSWVNIYTASGVAPATAIYIQNKTAQPVYLYTSATTPSDPDDGYVMQPYETIAVEAGDNAVWAKGNGPVNVQLA